MARELDILEEIYEAFIYDPNSLSGTTSKYKGVCWNIRAKKWKAQICFNYQTIHLGSFSSEELAREAYNEKSLELFGEYAWRGYGEV